MNPVDELFNLVKRCEHALVNLHQHFALMFIEVGIMTTFLHAVYCGNDFYAQVLLPYRPILPAETAGFQLTSSFYGLPAHLVRRKSLLRHENYRQSDRHRHGTLEDVLH